MRGKDQPLKKRSDVFDDTYCLANKLMDIAQELGNGTSAYYLKEAATHMTGLFGYCLELEKRE